MTVQPIAIIVPVLRRPWRVAPLVESIRASTPGQHRIVFVATETDREEVSTIEGVGLEPLILPGGRRPGDWARKVNHAYRNTTEPLMLLGADDLRFRPGWHEIVSEWADRGYGVIGTQDEGNPRVVAQVHSTHPVVARWYADEHGTVDGPGRVVSEVYDHNFVDDELVCTARSRDLWTFAPGAVVEHLHPHWNKSADDPTYQLGQSSFMVDRARFHRRRHLWK